MARSDPTRSAYCATRHLLQHLCEPRKLRRNPLAREAFVDRGESAALQAIAARVSRALRELDARRVAILVRVDIRRHAPAAVAADLGMSTRQFYRVRRLAHDRFLGAYRSNGWDFVEIRVVDDAALRPIARAVALADSGETASARAILDDLVGSGGDGVARCEALMRLAEIDAWDHRLSRARTYLRAADGALAESRALSVDERARLRDANAAVSLCLRWFADGPSAIAGTRAIDRRRLERDPEACEGGRSMLVRAAAAVRSGESTRAVALLCRLDVAEHWLRGPETIVDALALRAELADFTAEDPLLSETLLARAIAVAQANGLAGRELYCRHQLYSTRWMRTRDPGDRSAYRRLVDRTDRCLPPRLRSSLAFCTADIEVAIGHPRRALAAAEAAAAVSTNAYEALSAGGLAAGALLRLGHIADAGSRAAAAAEAARSSGHTRVLSLAQRISAQAFLAQGNRRAARCAIEESVDCARRFSSAHVLGQAQAVLGRVTGARPDR